jgi:FAD:protein FMN transferase
MRIILNGSVSTVKRLRIALGTLVAVEATVASPSVAEAAVEAAFTAIAEVDRRMHPRSVGSDLARINDAPLDAPITVHPSTVELLTLARRINTITDGVFDPCLPTQPGRLSDIDVLTDEARVICRAPVALDFGGFAKGYAVDCAIEALLTNGCLAGLVNAGGDLRVFGARAEPLYIRGPAGDLINIELTDAALAVSDTRWQQRPTEHQGYYTRNPTTAPAGLTYAAVIASHAVLADALTKCVLLCRPPVAAHALRELGAIPASIPTNEPHTPFVNPQ